ncbi:MAG: fructose-1,6-bisphosphatase [Selenomonadaceae bacterium]|nr:fructose-1,6-bisphosphatase [Selenomonadaceae bacterium]
MEKRKLTEKMLHYLAEQYPSKEAVYEKIIHLKSHLSLPKPTEHFVSDLHGEYAAFFHIVNNCSGVIREKVDYVFSRRMTRDERAEFCTLIYYPREKMDEILPGISDQSEWYRINISRLIELAKFMSYKYTASTVRSKIPDKFQSVVIELIGTYPELDGAQAVYHDELLDTIIQIEAGDEFIEVLSSLVKRLAVSRLHIVGDFFDRGNRPDAILNLLMRRQAVDIQWGNHDVLWMGAALGSEVCIAGVVRNSLHYNNTDVLERGYGISLRSLMSFATKLYPDDPPVKAAERAISIMMFKLEGQMIQRNPDFKMQNQLRLGEVDFHSSYALLSDGESYQLNNSYFPTINADAVSPYDLIDDEQNVIDDLKSYFVESHMLQTHLDYLYRKGSVYKCYNGNLLFHACVPLNDDGSFRQVTFEGQTYSGRSYFDYVDRRVRRAFLKREQNDLDFMYFLWCGLLSPITGREVKTFERTFISDEKTWKEPSDPYYRLIDDEAICEKILVEFGLNPKRGHIINGHVPVLVKEGQSPTKANGKVIVIDGGFSEAYHKKTGISGYTLISNSRGLRLLQHQQIADVRAALRDNQDIESVSEQVELQAYSTTIGDTDNGNELKETIDDLLLLLHAYRTGELVDTE